MASAEREPITGVWRRSDPLYPPPVKTRRICINFRSDLWQKWGGHVHPSSPRGDATANKIHMPQPVLRTNKWKINGKERHDKLNTSRSSYSVIFSSVLSPVGSTFFRFPFMNGRLFLPLTATVVFQHSRSYMKRRISL